jgi:DNA-binding IclR family transcriptional regulator
MKITKRNAPDVFNMALLHMVGQMQSMGQSVTIGDIAAYAQVSKQTAYKYAKELQERRFIYYVLVPYRPEVNKYHIKLTNAAMHSYEACRYIEAYKVVMQSRCTM